MGLLAKDKGGMEFTPCPTGMHHAICYGVVDIGTQPGFGKFPPKRKVVILYEFPDLRIDLPDKHDADKKVNLPRALSIKETLTLASKGNLRPILEGWRGRPFTEQELEGFDLKNVIGANALVNVIHDAGTGQNAGKIYANIKTVNPLAQGMKKRTNELPPVFFSFDDVPRGSREIKLPENLPQWVTGLIMQSDEYISISQGSNSSAPRHTDDVLDNTKHEEDFGDVPF